MANEPKFKRRTGQFEVAVWENDAEKNGNTFKVYSWSLQKSYKDKNDEWQRQVVHGSAGDVSRALTLLQEAQRFLHLGDKREEA